jgi:ATP-dependent Clp protease ATP-binding subunit ClpC
MPSSADRKRLEVPTYLYDRLVELSIDEDRTVASVVQEVIATGLHYYTPGIRADLDFARYTPRALRALEIARAETVPFNHAYLGTEHILLGLLRVDDGIAARVLTAAGVDAVKCRTFIELHIGRGEGKVPPVAAVPYAPRARKAIRFATEEADTLGHQNIGTEHLLLGLLRVPDGVAARMLAIFGIQSTIHTETLRAITRYEEPHPAPEASASNDDTPLPGA